MLKAAVDHISHWKSFVCVVCATKKEIFDFEHFRNSKDSNIILFSAITNLYTRENVDHNFLLLNWMKFRLS